jgi:hypothetical protein
MKALNAAGVLSAHRKNPSLDFCAPLRFDLRSKPWAAISLRESLRLISRATRSGSTPATRLQVREATLGAEVSYSSPGGTPGRAVR